MLFGHSLYLSDKLNKKMAYKKVSELISGVSGLLTGTNLDNVVDLDNALERATKTFLQKAKIPEASTSQIVTLYDGVINYPSVSPLFGSTVKDIRPVGQNRFSDDMVYRRGGEDFDRTKNDFPSGSRITFETENGVNIMRILSKFTAPKIVLDPMNAITGWTSGGTLSLLSQDTSFYYKSPASLRFKLTGSGTGYIERTLSQQLNLTSYQNVGVGFLALEIPTLNLSSVTLRLGSDSSNYYSVTATQGQLGAWTANDFLDTPFDLSTATTVGSPVITAIDYIRLSFTTTATISNVRCGYLWLALPAQHKILFSTTAIFRNTSGTISNVISNNQDDILLNDAAYNIYEHECAITIGLQMGGSMAAGLVGNLNAVLNGARAKNGQVISLGLYDLFRADNPSEEIRMVGNWYQD